MVESGTSNEFALLERLKNYLWSLDSLLVSYSGGLDSSFLAVVAQECLPGRVVCVLLDSPSSHGRPLKLHGRGWTMPAFRSK